MPAAWRVRVIGERLRAEGIEAVVLARDLLSLEGSERQAALDAMVVRGADVPMVLVDGAVVCSDGVDLDAMVAAARQHAGEGRSL